MNNNYTNSILNSITDSLIITTREGLIEELNHSAVKLLGYSSGDLLGRSVAELFVEDESTVDDDEFFSIDSPLMTLIEQGAWRRVDIRMLTKEKVQIPVSLSGEISTMVDGQEYMVIAAQDMREVIKMQEEAQFNAFQAGVAEMGANILHNIGNAVTGIYGNIHKINKQSQLISKVSVMLGESGKKLDSTLSSLMQEVSLPESYSWITNTPKMLSKADSIISKTIIDDIAPSIHSIEESVAHIAEIIKVQNGSASITNNASEFNLKELFDNIMVMQESRFGKYNIEVERNLNAVTKKLKLPRNQLIQLFINLLKNASEAIVEEVKSRQKK